MDKIKRIALCLIGFEGSAPEAFTRLLLPFVAIGRRSDKAPSRRQDIHDGQA